MYTWWWRNEWVERNVNGKVVYYVPRVVFTFYCPPHIVCTHKFSNPLFCRIRIIVVVIISYLYVHPHVPSILFSLLMRTWLCWWLGKTFLSILFNSVWVSTLTEHVENIINFISYGLTPYCSLLLPTFPSHTKISLLRFTEKITGKTENREVFHFLTFSENEIL